MMSNPELAIVVIVFCVGAVALGIYGNWTTKRSFDRLMTARSERIKAAAPKKGASERLSSDFISSFKEMADSAHASARAAQSSAEAAQQAMFSSNMIFSQGFLCTAPGAASVVPRPAGAAFNISEVIAAMRDRAQPQA